MSKLNFQMVLNRVSREINFITQLPIINYQTEVRKDAQMVIQKLKPEIEEWINKLNEKEISCAELYFNIQSQKDEIELENLSKIGISKEEVQFVKMSILQLVSNTIINFYLNSLFESQHLTKKSIENRITSIDFFEI
ncbi:MAG TPA: hypothetical protein P5084_03270 [Paludibacter sp.]|nr:hypothetical protein [Paludibacter sp.]